MEDQFRQEVYQSLADIFGTMFFIAIEEAGTPLSSYDGNAATFIEGRVEISGNGVTEVRFYFPVELATNITSNFMGVDIDALGDDMVLDAVREATNMVAGGILSRIDPQGRCRLGIPTAERKENFDPAEALPVADTTLYTSDYGILFLCCGELGVCRPSS